MIGYSQDSFYRFKELYEEQGEDGLRELSRRKPNLTNRVDHTIKEAVLAIALENPALGQLRVSNTLKQEVSLSRQVVCVQETATGLAMATGRFQLCFILLSIITAVAHDSLSQSENSSLKGPVECGGIGF